MTVNVSAKDLATIVHPNNRVDALSLGESRAIFAMKEIYWEHNRHPITIVTRPYLSDVHQNFVKNCLNGDPVRLRRLMQLRSNSGGGNRRKVAYSSRQMIKIVGDNPDAVGYDETSYYVNTKGKVKEVRICG